MHNNFDEFLSFRLIGNVSSCFFFLGLQRSVPVLAITRHNEEPEAAAVTAEGHPQDLADSVQGARRARAPGRLLSQPRGLVGAERPRRWPRQLRLSVECVHQPSKSDNLHLSQIFMLPFPRRFSINENNFFFADNKPCGCFS